MIEKAKMREAMVLRAYHSLEASDICTNYIQKAEYHAINMFSMDLSVEIVKSPLKSTLL